MLSRSCRVHGESLLEPSALCAGGALLPSSVPQLQGALCTPEIHRVSWCVSFISENTRLKEDQQLVGKIGSPAGNLCALRSSGVWILGAWCPFCQFFFSDQTWLCLTGQSLADIGRDGIFGTTFYVFGLLKPFRSTQTIARPRDVS